MTKSKFDCYLDTFDVKKSNPLPNETDQVLPVPSDVEQNSRFVLSRSRGLRDDVSSRVCEHNEPVVPSVPVPTPVPAQDYDPSPEERKKSFSKNTQPAASKLVLFFCISSQCWML